MATHRVTLDLSEEAVMSLRRRVASGCYESETDVVEFALMELDLPPAEPFDHNNPPQWFIDDMLAASAELDAHPERALTPEQVEQYLTRDRELRNHAA